MYELCGDDEAGFASRKAEDLQELLGIDMNSTLNRGER